MALYVCGQRIIQDGAVVIGNGNVVRGERLTVCGNRNMVTGSNSVVTGNRNLVVGNHVQIIGDDNRITGDCSMIVGENNYVAGQNCQINGYRVDRQFSRQNRHLLEPRPMMGNFIIISRTESLFSWIWSFVQSLAWSIFGCFFWSREQNTPMPPNPFREFTILDGGPVFILDEEDETNAPGGAATNIEGIKELKYTDEERPEEAPCCIVCLSRESDVVAMPCGHNNYCGYCVAKMHNEKILINRQTHKIK